MKTHKSDKIFFEFLIKNMLEYYGLIQDNLYKSEHPDFRNEKMGLEITRSDQTLEFTGFISKYNKDNIKNIKKFNSAFEKCGGRVLKKDSPIVKILDLHDTFHFHDDYIYIIPGYHDNFDFTNERVEDKLIKLNSLYDKTLSFYYLAIFTTIYVDQSSIIEELKKLINIQSKYERKFEKIIIVFIDKICEYDFLKKDYNIIYDTNDTLNKISTNTSTEINAENN